MPTIELHKAQVSSGFGSFVYYAVILPRDTSVNISSNEALRNVWIEWSVSRAHLLIRNRPVIGYSVGQHSFGSCNQRIYDRLERNERSFERIEDAASHFSGILQTVVDDYPDHVAYLGDAAKALRIRAWRP